jgi:hypothetical protein
MTMENEGFGLAIREGKGGLSLAGMVTMYRVREVQSLLWAEVIYIFGKPFDGPLLVGSSEFMSIMEG